MKWLKHIALFCIFLNVVISVVAYNWPAAVGWGMAGWFYVELRYLT